MKIAIGSDHAGYSLKAHLYKFLVKNGYEVKDLGAHSEDSVDYPDFAHPVASGIEEGEFDFGVLVCGSGQGVCMSANKHEGVRAALIWRADHAALTRQHNDANIICFPGRFMAEYDAEQAVETFLNTEFEGGRHERRVGKIPRSI